MLSWGALARIAYSMISSSEETSESHCESKAGSGVRRHVRHMHRCAYATYATWAGRGAEARGASIAIDAREGDRTAIERA